MKKYSLIFTLSCLIVLDMSGKIRESYYPRQGRFSPYPQQLEDLDSEVVFPEGGPIRRRTARRNLMQEFGRVADESTAEVLPQTPRDIEAITTESYEYDVLPLVELEPETGETVLSELQETYDPNEEQEPRTPPTLESTAPRTPELRQVFQSQEEFIER